MPDIGLTCRMGAPTPRVQHIGPVGVRFDAEDTAMAQRPVSIEGEAEQPKKTPCDLLTDVLKDLDSQPPPEEQLGGGDICSLEEAPSTDDDKPLD
jgi:hypothetical protein